MVHDIRVNFLVHLILEVWGEGCGEAKRTGFGMLVRSVALEQKFCYVVQRRKKIDQDIGMHWRGSDKMASVPWPARVSMC